MNKPPPSADAPKLPTLDDIRQISFRAMSAEDRVITPMEARTDNAPFDIRRVFTIQATRAGLVGGRHAHYRCTQLLVFAHGAVEVACLADPKDGERVWRLEAPGQGLLIPPGIWAEQRYMSAVTVLTVLCDEPYDPADYIRDFEVYRQFRAGA